MSPLTQEESTVYAMHCWLEFGVSSRSHPVIAFALAEFLTPLGVSADAFEIPAEDMIITGMDVARLINPHFSFDNVSWSRSAIQEYRDLRSASSGLVSILDGRGNLEIKIRPGMENDLALKAVMPLIQQFPEVVRDGFDQAVLFVLTACRVLAEDSNEAIVQCFGAGDHKRFCELVIDYMREALSGE